jgi:type VI secretion system secreted protein Hcp
MAERKGEVDLFLSIVGTKSGKIKGESADAKHSGEIEVETYSWDVEQPVSKHSGGLASGKREHGPFIVTFKTQSVTPKLIGCVCNGEHLKAVVLTCRKAGKEQQEYLKWTMETAMISKFETFYLEDDIVPRDRVTFAYRTIEIEYHQQNSDGTLGGAITTRDELGT